MVVPETGEVSAVVSGGSNMYGWEHWGVSSNICDDATSLVDSSNESDDGAITTSNKSDILSDGEIRDIVSSRSLLLLQCEVPHLVNLRLARTAHELNIPVILDVGGEHRKMDRELLECCDYLVPNETELERLAKSFQDDISDDEYDASDLIDWSLHEIARTDMKGKQAHIESTLNLPSIIKSIRTLREMVQIMCW